MSHSDVVRSSFVGQAAAFEDATRNFNSSNVVHWLIENTPAEAGEIVLEVAAGTGIFARAIAESVATVVAVDVTPEMLAAGKLSADVLGIRNVVWQEGDATRLPFLDDTFDRVITRLSVHHFEDPSVVLQEMTRVCRPGGTITIVDMVVIDGTAQQRFNDLERRRDPSHTRAVTRTELRAAIEATGCQIIHTATRENILNAQEWFDQTSTPDGEQKLIRAAWANELAGGPATGMDPIKGSDDVQFTHYWDLHVATVPRESTKTI